MQIKNITQLAKYLKTTGFATLYTIKLKNKTEYSPKQLLIKSKVNPFMHMYISDITIEDCVEQLKQHYKLNITII